MRAVKHASFFVFLSILMLALSQACTNADEGRKATKENGNNLLIERARNVTTRFRLTEIPISCLDFKVAKEKFDGKMLVVVREKHGGECGGDPGTSPRLYSIAFDETTGEIWSDARSLLGQMEAISK